MANLLRISDGATLALHAMALLASVKAGRLSVREIADRLAASRAHLSKVSELVLIVDVAHGINPSSFNPRLELTTRRPRSHAARRALPDRTARADRSRPGTSLNAPMHTRT